MQESRPDETKFRQICNRESVRHDLSCFQPDAGVLEPSEPVIGLRKTCAAGHGTKKSPLTPRVEVETPIEQPQRPPKTIVGGETEECDCVHFSEREYLRDTHKVCSMRYVVSNRLSSGGG